MSRGISRGKNIERRSRYFTLPWSHCFKLLRFYSFSFNLSNVGEISGVESERTVSKITKRKRKFLCCVHLLHKTGALSFHLGSFRSKSCNDG